MSRSGDPEWGAAALTNCLCAHLGPGSFWVNEFAPSLNSCKHLYLILGRQLSIITFMSICFLLGHFITMRASFCCADRWVSQVGLNGRFSCFSLVLCVCGLIEGH